MLTTKLEEGARHFAAGRLQAAARAYREAERLAPGDLRAGYSLAVIDIRQGRLARAHARLEALVADHPEHFMAQHNLGAVRQQLNDWAGAAAAYGAAVELRPEAAETREALAVALAIVGRTREAVEQHRILAGDPARRWRALTRMALLEPSAIGDDALTGMRRAAADTGVEAEIRCGLWFALGEALEARGAGDEAYEAFAAGNRLKRSLVDADAAAAAHAGAAARIRATCTRAFLEAHEGRGHASAAPIFIVGFPRSGSTLVEQILASHPAVQGLGETGVLPDVAATALAPGRRLSAARLREFAERYLAAMRARGWDGASRFVDKTLENYLHVGLIALVFPRAVILHTRRDPVDTGWSCFRQLFANGNETLYDLADIGAEYRRYREMMNHWRTVLSGRVTDVDYEALVTDPEPQVRRLLEAAGLPWDPDVLRFHERGGPVRTASAVQVRRPISAEGVRRWRQPADRLAPLITALGEQAADDPPGRPEGR